MKISKIVLALLMITSLLSCKSDDDGGNLYLLTAANIAGTHTLEYLHINAHQVFVINGIEITSNIAAVGSTFQVTFTFAENGTYSAEGEFLMTATTTVAGQSNVETEIVVLDENGTYTVNTSNDTITINGFDGLDGTFDVTVFNPNAMTWIQDLSEITSDGTIDTHSELRFERD